MSRGRCPRPRWSRGSLVADLKKGKDIPVGIGDLEAPQAVIDERQLFHERRTPLLELVEQRVGKDSFEHDADPVPAHLAIVHVVTMKNGLIEARFR